MSRTRKWVCKYCATNVDAVVQPSECDNCGGPLRAARRDDQHV